MVGSAVLRKGAWTEEEDQLLRKCIEIYGEGKWHQVPLRAGLNRCRKSCRLRWLNYLSPNIKRGEFAADEVDLMRRLHKLLGNRWSLIAGRLPGRTSNDVKNYWNTHLQKKTFRNKRVSHETTEVVKPIIIRPRPRIFSKSSPWLREKVTILAENVQIKDTVNNLSPALQLQALENDNKWWESLLEDKNDNGEITCSTRELEDEPIRNLWLEDIAPPTEMGNTTVEKGKNHWSEISFEADDIWNILSAV